MLLFLFLHFFLSFSLILASDHLIQLRFVSLFSFFLKWSKQSIILLHHISFLGLLFLLLFFNIFLFDLLLDLLPEIHNLFCFFILILLHNHPIIPIQLHPLLLLPYSPLLFLSLLIALTLLYLFRILLMHLNSFLLIFSLLIFFDLCLILCPSFLIY